MYSGPATTKLDLSENYPTIRVFADLSATTFRRRKEFSQVVDTLHAIRFRWGFPTIMLVTREGSIAVITSPEDGLRKLQTWGIHFP
ncbi:Hypothetical predicted protein [Pelobates cultripes]|uniref:Uncharacterized protein n=1 Tax=Pelobates cultripes TaxID=61616 RepID=A0AAD1WQ27_PELCU|nr:Hypothetical predicted protein [Pelobates cultripes]